MRFTLHQKQYIDDLLHITHADLFEHQPSQSIYNNCVIEGGCLRVLACLMVQSYFPHFNPVLMDAWCFARKFPMNHKIAASIFYARSSSTLPHTLRDYALLYAYEVEANMLQLMKTNSHKRDHLLCVCMHISQIFRPLRAQSIG